MDLVPSEPGKNVVGRESELAALQGFLAPGGARRALVITGQPGIGKTTLWEDRVDGARRQGMRVLFARPSGAEAQLSFAALVDLPEGVDTTAMHGVPPPQLRALEVALLRAESVSLVPEPRAIALGLLNTLRSLAAEGPVLVAVDDVQWLDRASADALAFAARRLQGSGVLFLLARPSGASSRLERTLEPAGIERLEISPLSLGATRRLLFERLGATLPRRLLRRIFESAGGNPLFALELGRALVERGSAQAGEELPVPDRIEDLLGTRISKLPGPQRRLLLAVALCSALRVEDLGAIADPTAIEDAFGTGLLLLDGGRVRASHPLLAAAAKRRSRASERGELHRVLAGAVADEGLRARLLAAATEQPDAELAVTVAAAAAIAIGRGAVEDAVELAEHALRLTPSESAEWTDRLLTFASYLMVSGELQRATNLLAPEADRLPAGSARARAHLILAESRWVGSHIDKSGDHLDRALTESAGDPTLRAIVLARRSKYTAVACVERIRDAEAWALEALPAARAAGPAVERDVLHSLGWARSLRGRSIDDLCERFRTVSDDAFHIYRSLDRAVGERLATRGDVNQASAILRRLLDLADERGELMSYVALRLQLCEVELRAGQWETAAGLLDEWDESPDGGLLVAPAYQRCRALLAAGRGRPAEAEHWASKAIAGSEASGLIWDLLEARRVRGLAALLAHEPGQAAQSLRVVWEHTRREGVDDPGVFPVAPDLVEALAELGETEEALAVIDRLQQLSEEQDHPWGLATAKRCAGLVQLASHASYEEAAQNLEAAAAAYGELGLRFDRARSLLILGRAGRRLKKWGAARGSLERAAAAFDEIGSVGWAEQAHSELARVGARRPPSEGKLTPTEQRVGQLAADGLSNKEIAQALFVSVHTVEVHLSHAYAKFVVRSRSQLALRLSAEP